MPCVGDFHWAMTSFAAVTGVERSRNLGSSFIACSVVNVPEFGRGTAMIDRLRSASAGAVDSTADGASEVWWAADCGRQLVIKARMSIDVIRIWHITPKMIEPTSPMKNH